MNLEGDGVLRFLAGKAYGDGNVNIVCPHCGSDYTHVSHVGTLLGSDEHEAGIYEGTVQIGATAIDYRRSAVAIVFDCENCPTQFSLVVQQHKGVNLVQIHLPA